MTLTNPTITPAVAADSESTNGLDQDGGVGPTLICNGFADDNRGGAALTIATLEALRATGEDSIDLLALAGDAAAYPCTTAWDPDIRLRTHDQLGVRHTRFRLALAFLLAIFPRRLTASALGRRVARSIARYLVPQIEANSAVVLKPGYVLVSRQSAGSLASLVSTTTPIVAAWAVGVPAVGVGHSVVITPNAGSVWERMSALYVTRLLRKMTAISVRDDASYDDVADATVGAATELRLFPDVALMYPWQDADDSMSWRPSGARRIGIAVGHGSPGPTEDQYVDAVLRLASGPTEVAIIQQSTDRRDIERAERIRQRLVSLGVMTRSFHPPPDLLSSISLWRGVDMAITARMHAAIFCVIVGTPVRLLEGDSRKARQVLHSVELDRVMAPDLDTIDDFSGEDYTEEVLAARAAWPEFVAWLTAQLDATRTPIRQ